MSLPGGNRRAGLAIFWISVLGLYLELLMIRWISTEIRIFAYLQNTILVVCFLGLGIGLFTSRRPIAAGRAILALLVLAGALAIQITRGSLLAISYLLSSPGEIVFWGGWGFDTRAVAIFAATIGLFLTFLVMVLILETFVPIGRFLGRLMDDHPRPIVAYSLNVAGSLAGIWLFVTLSSMEQPPAVWFLVLAVLALPLFGDRRRLRWLQVGALLGVAGLVAVGSGEEAAETVWSPYQKLSIQDFSRVSPPPSGKSPLVYFIRVNNTGYQAIFDLRLDGSGFEREGPGSKYLSHYDIPPLLHPAPEDVLLVGAGAGNDAAGALRQGAVRVTAVEIDPVIVDFGRRYHPERPYESERVRVVVDDARSFFATTDERFDVISFGLLDSHTTTSLTNARLDHYVYTRESIARARELLREGGILTLLFAPLRPYIIDRLGTVLRDVFGEEPLVFRVPSSQYGPGGILFVAGDLKTARARIDGVELLSPMTHWAATDPVELTYETVPATDDWPYLYLESPRIPLLFVFLAGLLGLQVLYARHTLELPRAMSPMRWERSTWHFFFLGAAFLLLEVQNISKASVALGNTWLVNAVIISGVLTMVLLANLIVIRWPAIPLGPVYGVLLATVGGLYFVDIARFAFLPFGTKAVVVGGLTTLPMLFSGIVFVRAFVVAEGKDVALGANLLGALVGAVLESLSFLLGIKALLLVVALFYSLAMLTRPARERFAEATSPALDDALA